MSGILNSSIGRKFAMALSALFLIVFLIEHFIINLTSVFSEDVFNNVSLYMGTNWLIQFVMQPILIFAVVFHFVMGFVLEIKNNKARNIKYAQNKGSANSSWVSRNMIWSGLVILGFLGLHFYDFWLPEISTKYIHGDMSGLMEDGNDLRFFHELQEKFLSPVRVGLYCLAFVFLAMHLLHGFNSAFQSIGANNKYTKGLKGFGKGFAIVIPLGFVVIALYHHFNHIS
ncbi:MAG TPA: succinate dehydrogenase cytochrome b subunit [Flavobacteriaceae bacterium]|jgi:succinate dehydrogenase / fumarate reductase cytochrome b subunit